MGIEDQRKGRLVSGEMDPQTIFGNRCNRKWVDKMLTWQMDERSARHVIAAGARRRRCGQTPRKPSSDAGSPHFGGNNLEMFGKVWNGVRNGWGDDGRGAILSVLFERSGNPTYWPQTANGGQPVISLCVRDDAFSSQSRAAPKRCIHIECL